MLLARRARECEKCDRLSLCQCSHNWRPLRATSKASLRLVRIAFIDECFTCIKEAVSICVCPNPNIKINSPYSPIPDAQLHM